MRFFARLVFLCNICFIGSVILRFVEINNSAKGNANLALKFQPLESTFVILGYGAIFLNLLFVIFSLYWFATKKIKFLPRFIVMFNLVMFPLQVYYFFYSNF
ncbi:MAG: hypothetical protein ABIT07_07160 [Ferruginibacter sp.]